MLIVRWVVLLMLVASAVCFALYAGTGQERFKKLGLATLKWTLGAAFIFFAVLAFERLA